MSTTTDIVPGSRASHEPTRDTDAECRVLGDLLLRPDHIAIVGEMGLSSPCFDYAANRFVWTAVSCLYADGIKPDPPLVVRWLTEQKKLEDVGVSYVFELVDGAIGLPADTLAHYVQTLITLMRARQARVRIAQVDAAIREEPARVFEHLAQLQQHIELGEAENVRRPQSVALPDFLHEWGQRPPAPMLANDLVPGEGIVLIHGQPRAKKTQTTQSMLLSLAAGCPVFNNERFHVREAVPCLYITQEDGPGRNAERLAAHVRGLGLREIPRHFRVAIHKGFCLDDPEWQQWLFDETKREGFRAVELDPLRSVTDFADQGPKDFKPAATFLREFTVKTGAVVIVAHHDAKPPVNGTDTRTRPQRASGGGLFSIADAPIHLEALDSASTLVAPTAWKFGTDPDPFILRLESDDARRPTVFRFQVQDTNGQTSAEVALQSKIVNYLRDHSGASGSQIAKGVRTQKETVLHALEHMARIGLLDSFPGPRNSTRWLLSGERTDSNGS